MVDHREQLARNLHIYSPTSKAHTRHQSEGDRDFSFWGSSNITSYENECDQLGGNEAPRLNKEAEFREHYRRTSLKFEHSPFLSHTHHCCNNDLSDPSKSKAIEEGRRELMEMMQDMPESSYELSFQDMVVDEKHVLQQPDQNETSLGNTHMHSSSSSSNSNKAISKKVNNKKKKSTKSNNRPGQISRVESMDSETFLLKMFFPSSLKKVKVENGSSKVSPRPSSLQDSIKQVGKECRIKRFFQAGNNRGDMEDSMCQNTRRSSSSIKSRNFDRDSSFSSLGCLPFFPHPKNKAKERAG